MKKIESVPVTCWCKGLLKKTNQWIEGMLLKNRGILYIVQDKIEQGNPLCEDFEVKRNSVCPFTGMKDKEGKKVFEGDLLYLKYNDTLVVRYIEDSFMAEKVVDEKESIPLREALAMGYAVRGHASQAMKGKEND